MTELDLGGGPTDEPWIDTTDPFYMTNARIECLKYIRLLRSLFGREPLGSTFKIKVVKHREGDYLTVMYIGDMEYMCDRVNKLPEHWR